MAVLEGVVLVATFTVGDSISYARNGFLLLVNPSKTNGDALVGRLGTLSSHFMCMAPFAAHSLHPNRRSGVRVDVRRLRGLHDTSGLLAVGRVCNVCCTAPGCDVSRTLTTNHFPMLS